jgi:DNA-binding GntR family transcriptional regulator
LTRHRHFPENPKPSSVDKTARAGSKDEEVRVLRSGGDGFEAPLALSEAIFRHIGQAIVEGSIPPNQRLVETQLCAQFGCSRSPLREAIRMLAAEGLVTITPRRGARVVQLTPKTLRDVFEVRVLLEGLAARLAAENRSDGDLAELKSLSASMRAAVEGGPETRFFTLNNSFHRAIARIGANDYLASLQETAANRTFLPLFLFLSDKNHLATAVEAHEEIVGAIERRDGAESERAMSRHVRQIQTEAERLVASRLAATAVSEKAGAAS